MAYGTTAQTRTLTLGGTNIGNNTFGKVIANNTGGTNLTSLVKAGVGTWVLNQVNTYGGSTQITGGILSIAAGGTINSSSGVSITNGGEFRYNSSTNLSPTVTFTNGTISGTNWNGSLSGLTIGANNTISPGNSPGTATTVDQTWGPSGSYLFEINNAEGAAGAASGWDLVNGTGALTISATSSNTFTIDLVSLTSMNAAGLADNFDDTMGYAWLIADFASITGFDADSFFIDDTGFANPYEGTFAVALGDTVSGGNNTQIYVTYTAIPEPSTMLLGALGALALLRRRRQG